MKAEYTNTATAATQEHQRDQSLDGVRGLAMLFVLLIHCFTLQPTNPVTSLLSNVFQSMFVGLDLFFVLSGFLITSILVRTKGRGNYLSSFFWRRGLRILPAYLIMLVYAFAIAPLLNFDPAPEATRSHLVWYLLYVQNLALLLDPTTPVWGALAHLWSLAIEEHYYLLWPFAILLVPARHLEKFCIAVFVLGCAFKLGAWWGGADWTVLYYFTPCRIEGLAIGSWIAVRCELLDLRKTPFALKLAGMAATIALLVLAVLPVTDADVKFHSPVLIALHTILGSLAFAWLIYSVVEAQPGAWVRRIFGTRIMVFLGTYSYGFYLIHFFVLMQLRPMFEPLTSTLGVNKMTVLLGCSIIIVSLPLTLLMYHLVEEPALRLKDRVKLLPRAQKTMVPASPGAS